MCTHERKRRGAGVPPEQACACACAQLALTIISHEALTEVRHHTTSGCKKSLGLDRNQAAGNSGNVYYICDLTLVLLHFLIIAQRGDGILLNLMSA